MFAFEHVSSFEYSVINRGLSFVSQTGMGMGGMGINFGNGTGMRIKSEASRELD